MFRRLMITFLLQVLSFSLYASDFDDAKPFLERPSCTLKQLNEMGFREQIKSPFLCDGLFITSNGQIYSETVSVIHTELIKYRTIDKEDLLFLVDYTFKVKIDLSADELLVTHFPIRHGFSREQIVKEDYPSRYNNEMLSRYILMPTARRSAVQAISGMRESALENPGNKANIKEMFFRNLRYDLHTLSMGLSVEESDFSVERVKIVEEE